jgi:hypothetical protein
MQLRKDIITYRNRGVELPARAASKQRWLLNVLLDLPKPCWVFAIGIPFAG